MAIRNWTKSEREYLRKTQNALRTDSISGDLTPRRIYKTPDAITQEFNRLTNSLSRREIEEINISSFRNVFSDIFSCLLGEELSQISNEEFLQKIKHRSSPDLCYKIGEINPNFLKNLGYTIREENGTNRIVILKEKDLDIERLIEDICTFSKEKVELLTAQDLEKEYKIQGKTLPGEVLEIIFRYNVQLGEQLGYIKTRQYGIVKRNKKGQK